MIIVVLVVFGLCFGSFVNALVFRLHEKPRAKTNKQKAQLSITKGRSMCVHCHHTLAWHDLLPVISWLSLGGKCRYCKKPISWQYPLVELLTAVLFVFSYLYFPYVLSTMYYVLLALWLALVVGFMALLVYDLKWMLLPDKIVFPLQAVAGLYVLLLTVMNKDATVVVQALLAVLCSAGLFYALFQVSKGKWIGGGDVKLAVVLGLVLSQPIKALLMLFIASWLGTIAGLPLLLKGKAKTTKIPFGPFLIIATIVVYLFGSGFIAWYSRQFLFL
jgi:prepilin signal peptidase PulO-like enzyme (type II secretory pathway)